MTLHQRIAAGECVRLMALLADSGTPHSKELALIVAMRLVAIVDEEEPASAMLESDIAPWLTIARSLAGEILNGIEARRKR